MFLSTTHFLFSQSGSALDFNSIMPILGVVIIFLCLVAYFIPATRQIGKKNQIFEGAGVRMQVSILTVFVLMGFALSLTS
jgi:hypothetical protein